MEEIKVYDQDGKQITMLVQWDLDVYIYIKDDRITTNHNVHFFNSESDVAYVVSSTYEDGILCCKIPNRLLFVALPITGYIYTTGDNDTYRSTYVFNILVRSRVIPSDFMYIPDAMDDYISVVKVLAWCEDYARSACQCAADAEDWANLSKSWAVGDTGVRDGEDTDNSKYYCQEASDSATLAESWAVGGTGSRKGEDTDNSKYYAQQASTSASNASTSEKNAASSADSAAESAEKAATFDPDLYALREYYANDSMNVGRKSGSTSGYKSFVLGGDCIASSSYSHAEGNTTEASGGSAHAECYYTKATGTYSHSEGQSTEASGSGAHSEGYNTLAEGSQSHAEGHNTVASGNYSHAEGNGKHGDSTDDSTGAFANYSHSEGCYTIASGSASHAEGDYTVASGSAAHAEGYGSSDGSTGAFGNYSHVEGYKTSAFSDYSHAEGSFTIAGTEDGDGQYSHAEGRSTNAAGAHSHAEGRNTTASGPYSHAEGYETTASSSQSHAEGYNTTASGQYSHAEGCGTVATHGYSHAEGYQTHAGDDDGGYEAHAEGYETYATGNYSHAEGQYAKATGRGSHAQGYMTQAQAPFSFAAGYESRVIADDSLYATGGAAFGNSARSRYAYSTAIGNGVYTGSEDQTVVGCYNRYTGTGEVGSSTSSEKNVFVAGGGDSNSRYDAFRVTNYGYVYARQTFNASGADYAEFIKEWADGNPDEEDRVGYFVTIKDGYLYKANKGDYIVGITSGNPGVVGNVDEDYFWKYQKDDFGRVIREDVDEEIYQWVSSAQEPRESDEKSISENSSTESAVSDTDDAEEEIMPDGGAETGSYQLFKTGNVIKNRVMALSEDYDESLQDGYVERKDRPEWDYVGMMGVIPVRDDGTCKVDAYCKCGSEGIATYAEERGFDTYYVIERVSDNVVSVIMR